MITMLTLADGTELDVVREVEVSPIRVEVVLGTTDYSSLSELSASLTSANLAKVDYYNVSDTDDDDKKLIRSYTDMTIDTKPKFEVTEKGNYLEVAVCIRKLSDDEKRERKIMELINTLSDEDALLFKTMYPSFEDLNGVSVEKDTKFVYDGLLYKTTEALVVDALTGLQLDETGNVNGMFKCIDVHHEGTYEDPIEYNKFVTLEPGKFYTEMGIEYVCLQTPGKPITENLCDVVDLWVREPLEMDIYPNYPSEPIYDYNAEINPWPCGLYTLYEGNIYLANGDGAVTAPSKEDTDNWEFVSKAKPGQTEEVYVKPEPVPEPEPIQPSIPDESGTPEQTPSNGENTDTSNPGNENTGTPGGTPDESGSTEQTPSTGENTGESGSDTTGDNTSETTPDTSGSTEQTPSTGENTGTTETTPDSGSTEETTPDTSKDDNSETVETPEGTETPSTKEDTGTDEQTPSTGENTDTSNPGNENTSETKTE